MNKFESITKPLKWFMALLLAAFVAGCSEGSDPILGGPSFPDLVSITVTPATASIPKTGEKQFKATAIYSNGSNRDVTATSTWTSVNVPLGGTAVATLSPDGVGGGVATGQSVGTATITATYVVGTITKTATASLTVNAATSVSFVVTPATASIPVSGTQKFTAIEIFSDGSTQDRTATSTWTSVNVPLGGAAVATLSPDGVGGGVATGQSVGTATINAAFGTKIATPATLTVNAATSASFVVTPATASIPVSGTQKFAAIETFSDGTTQDRTATSTWTSVNVPLGGAAVATLSPDGVGGGIATGQLVGTATINATFGTKIATPATLTVNAATVVSINVTPATASIVVNGTQQYTATAILSDGSTNDVTSNVSTAWSAVNVPLGGAAVATLSLPGVGGGVATGQVVGTSNITAAFGGHTSPAVTLTVIAGPSPGPAGAAAVLSMADTYGIIASNAITGSATTHIFGDVALTLPSSTSTSVVGFTSDGVALPNRRFLEVTDSTGVNPGLINTTDNGNLTIAQMAQLQTDLQKAYNDNKWGSPTRVPPGVSLTVPPAQPSAGGTFPTGVVDLGGMVLGPGIYAVNTGSDTFALSTPLVLDAQGNPDAVFVFQASDITTTTGDVNLINGAQAKNVFWVMTATATIGANTFFQGTIITGLALTVNTGASVQGRMLAAATGAGALVVSGAVISVPK